MSKMTLKFDNIKVNKRKFHKSKQPIDLGLVKVGQIVVSDKFKHCDHGFNILLVTKKAKSLNRYISYLTVPGTSQSDVLEKS